MSQAAEPQVIPSQLELPAALAAALRARPDALDEAIALARDCLLSQQKPDGHWVGELQGDTILESEYILLMAFLGRHREARVQKAAHYIVTQARPDGGWSNYPGGPADLNVSVKAYFALKITGHDPEAVYMRQARSAILQLGGAAFCNSFTKFYLAFLGQFPYENCASVPPELMFLPTWAYVNIYAMSSWTRTIVVPLTIFSAYKPVRRLPPELGIAELFVLPPHTRLWPHPPTRRWFTATNTILGVDQCVKWLERWGPQWVRREAVKRASAWMRAHFADSDGVGAIFPPIIYTIISLHCLGYAADSPEMIYALSQLERLMIEEEDTMRVQPCFSPVWDTALSLNTLAAVMASRPTSAARDRVHDAVEKGSRWLLDREVRRPGDWSIQNPGLEPGGWFFEYNNGFFPDTDDTAMVLMALARTGQAAATVGSPWSVVRSDGSRASDYGLRTTDYALMNGSARPPLLPAVERGVRWLLAMQNDDGGWAAFDRNINRQLLTKVPFADHNAMLDPSCPDITGRALEALGQYGYGVNDDTVARGLAFIAQSQDHRGCWPGRWGVNYVYGTWQVLSGVHAVGYDMRAPLVRRAVNWLQKVQQESGAWGESCHSYNEPSTAGQGPATASQTAWALLALLAAGERDSDAVRRGVDYLVRTQQPDGSWHEDQFTGTGFPKVFYLKYHMYRLYFPLMALARYRRLLPARTPSVHLFHRRAHHAAFSPHSDDEHGRLYRQEEAIRSEALSAGADAGAPARL